MYPIVSLILVPNVDWNVLTRAAQESLGRSITGAADRGRLAPAMPPALVVILGSILNQRSSASELLKEALPSTLDHLHFGFAIQTDRENFPPIMALTSRTLAFTVNEDFAVMSGTLKEWREVCILALSPSADVRVRMIFENIFSLFETLGLREVWGGYNKKSNGLNSFVLVPNA